MGQIWLLTGDGSEKQSASQLASAPGCGPHLWLRRSPDIDNSLLFPLPFGPRGSNSVPLSQPPPPPPPVLYHPLSVTDPDSTREKLIKLFSVCSGSPVGYPILSSFLPSDCRSSALTADSYLRTTQVSGLPFRTPQAGAGEGAGGHPQRGSQALLN